MTLWTLARLYGLMAVAFFLIDIVWIGTVAASFYDRYLSHMMRAEVNWTAALIFYAIYISGILVFAVLPGVESASLLRTVTLGAFLGFFAYATFDLTCMALFDRFSWTVVVVDIAWGTVLTGSVAAAGYFSAQWLGVIGS